MTTASRAAEHSVSRSSLKRRLVPLHIAVALEGFFLWVPIEKLFMNEIGFDPVSIGIMAATYAAVVPAVELVSGVLADRWSRKGALAVGAAALAVSALIGGLSTNVASYIVAALVFGVWVAMYSGALEAVVYDTVLEETGNSDAYEPRIGRVRLVESVSMVASALLGGWIAGMTSTRLTYFLTVPFAVLAVVAFLRFDEPQLHKAERAPSLRSHLTVTYRTVASQGGLLPIVAVAVFGALVAQLIAEFGPLWLVALAAPAVVFGPYWAALMSTFGLGGLLAGRIRLDRAVPLGIVIALTLLSGLVLTTGAGIVAVTIAQVVLVMLLTVIGIHVSHRLHDAVPSSVRSGVASGVGALTWITFLPFALVFGVVIRNSGVQAAGWIVTGVTALVGVLLMVLARRREQPGGAEPNAVVGATPERELQPVGAA